MKTYLLLFSCCLLASGLHAQFEPPAGVPGTSAIHKDSAVFTAWATNCTIVRGYQDISNPSLGLATAGDSSMALGIAGSNGLVSLGDGGIATLTFAQPITNGPDWDFAVFENSFDGLFLELAFVEVSSDGVNFFRFPAVSNTQDSLQISAFDLLDATKINNLAGKYQALYGTPFDLDELENTPGLNVNAITHVRIVDVVGSISPTFGTVDSNGHLINDPWNTPFISSGFDLDAVGVIHQISGVEELPSSPFGSVYLYPQPATAQTQLSFELSTTATIELRLIDCSGRLLDVHQLPALQPGKQVVPLTARALANGIYTVQLRADNFLVSIPFVVAQ